MKRLIALIVGGFGIVAYLRRRRKKAEPDVSPADELRSKIAESREAEAEAAATDEEPGLETDLEKRRREVHDRAQGAIDELS